MRNICVYYVKSCIELIFNSQPLENITMSMQIKWDARLENLADSLIDEWIATSRSHHAPFGKICVVVNDSATEAWLKQHFLLVRRVPQVLVNLEFVRLQQFVNDWMQAQVHGVAPKDREAGHHPYSQEVMAWRIYRLLEQAENNGDYPELLAYIGDDQSKKPQRRFALAEQLSLLYDNYLNSRFQMLRNWETGQLDAPAKVPAWQIALYQRLVAENPDSYASDFERALQPETDAALAMQHGFPKYLAVHVFDIPFMPEPTLRLLEKIAEALPVTFWNFNPLGDWLGETPSLKEAQRRLRQQLKKMAQEHRNLLQAGQTPAAPDTGFSGLYDTPEERLLGILASGARGLLGALCDDSNGDVQVLDDKPPFASLKAMSAAKSAAPPISLHSCASPRRELEALRDGLHHFFATHPKAKPQDALVLCADWDNYAPIIDSVFGTDKDSQEYIPLTVEGSLTSDTPLCQSFLSILEFRRNRFEVSSVFRLLSMPDIREKFGLDENSVSALSDMAKNANIHWGYDEQDVERILGKAPEQQPQYTWQRGLDRLATEMLHGMPESFYTFINAQGLVGTLRPCGHVEGERAEALASLWQLVTSLAAVRKMLASGQCYTAEEISSILMHDVLDTFFAFSDKNLNLLNRIRQAIREVVADINLAGLDQTELDCETFLTALESRLGNQRSTLRTSANSVLFAPLRTTTATPHQFVWICGLNNGTFPRLDHKPTFDVLGNSPSLFDTSLRERDAFALLKAVLSARSQLTLSYQGRDIRSNDSIPPSVLLTDLTDYFAAAGLPCQLYQHPLHGYNRRYFQQALANAPLPPSYSQNDCDLAKALAAPKPPEPQVTAFPLTPGQVTDIELDELIEFYTNPHKMLLKRCLNISDPTGHFQKFYDNERLDASLPYDLQDELFIYGFGQVDKDIFAQTMVEIGRAPDCPSAAAAAELVLEGHDSRPLVFANAQAAYNCYLDDSHSLPLQMSKACQLYEEAPAPEEKTIQLLVNNCDVRLHVKVKTVELETGAGTARHLVDWSDSDAVRWLRHLAVNAVGDGGNIASLVTNLSKVNDNRIRPVPQEEARQHLCDLLSLACSPLPPGFPDFQLAASQAADLPDEGKELVKTGKTYYDRTNRRGTK